MSDTPTSRGGLATTSSSELVNGNKNRLATGATNNPQHHDRSATKAADIPVNWDRPPFFGPRFPGTFGVRGNTDTSQSQNAFSRNFSEQTFAEMFKARTGALPMPWKSDLPNPFYSHEPLPPRFPRQTGM